MRNNGTFDFDQCSNYKAKWDLRNPKIAKIKSEIFKAFGLDPEKSYVENSILTKTALLGEINKQISQ